MSQNSHTSRHNSGGIWSIGRIYRFYRDGFREMTVGRYLWVMILLKLFILFFVFKLFFFPNILSRDYSTESERAQAVRSSLLDPRR